MIRWCVFVLVAALACSGCQLQPVATEADVEGPADSLRYLFTGEGEPTAAPISIHYKTAADKSVALQIDKAFHEDGSPSSYFLDASSSSDSQIAGAARARDNQRIESTTAATLDLVAGVLALVAPVALPPAAPAPPAMSPTQEEQIKAWMLEVLNQVPPAAPPDEEPAAEDPAADGGA